MTPRPTATADCRLGQRLGQRLLSSPALLGALPVLVALPLLGALVVAPPSWGQGRRQPEPHPSKPNLYDPDRTTCDAERIRTAFQQQLQPYRDQSPAVLAQLRRVQLEMTAKTLRRCVERNLLTRQQADQLFKELARSGTRP